LRDLAPRPAELVRDRLTQAPDRDPGALGGPRGRRGGPRRVPGPSLARPAGAGSGAAVGPAGGAPIAASTSARVISPPRPEPRMVVRSTPPFRASCLISGEARGTRALGDGLH